MKSKLFLLSTLLLGAGLVACGGQNSPSSSAANPSTTSSSTPAVSSSEKVSSSVVSEEEFAFPEPTNNADYFDALELKDYVEADYSSKTIAYQLFGENKSDYGDTQVLVNLYADGFVQVCRARGLSYASSIYGYWYVEDGEAIVVIPDNFDLAKNRASDSLFISISYEDDSKELVANVDITLLASSGFQMSIAVYTDGLTKVTYATTADFYNAYITDYKAGSEVPSTEEEKIIDYGDKELLFQWTAPTGTQHELNFYADGTYNLVWKGEFYSAYDDGTWSWENWTMTLAPSQEGSIATASMDDAHALIVDYYLKAAQETIHFSASTAVWGVKLGASGSYTPVVPAAELFAFTGGWNRGEALVFFDDLTYKFTFSTAEETGTWSFVNWQLSMVPDADFSGAVISDAGIDAESHDLKVTYQAHASSQLKITFSCPSSVWGAALGASGTYEK